MTSNKKVVLWYSNEKQTTDYFLFDWDSGVKHNDVNPKLGESQGEKVNLYRIEMPAFSEITISWIEN